MDARILKRVKAVAKVTGKPVRLDDATLVFFLCPCLSSKGITVRKDGLGYSAKYVNRLSITARERINKTLAFRAAAADVGWQCEPVAVWGSADAFILYDQTDFPLLPENIPVKVVSNYEPVQARISDFWSYYESQPWLQGCLQRAVKQEQQRLLSLLPNSCRSLRLDFVRRVFAGFALDGMLLQLGTFGRNPIILGVESPGVTELQNAVLPPFNRVPVIQLP